MTMNHEEAAIVNSVDALERERLRHQARERELRHVRRSGWARAFLIVGALACGLGLGVPVINRLGEQWLAEHAHQQAAEQKHLDDREHAWQKCIETQGIQACTLIEERTFASCYSKWNDEKTHECIKKRLSLMPGAR